MIVYRYDNEEYGEDTIIRSRGDSFSILTEFQKQVELAIRSTLVDGVNIRSNSVYTWADEKLARRLWPFSGKKYLYELEIENSNIRHIGDLNWYSAAEDAIKAQVSPESAVEKYCSGELAGAPYTQPRIEVLVSEARVLKRFS
jgi:hypothetical protein